MTKEKFYSKVLGSDRNGCHIWGYSKDRNGYGCVGFNPFRGQLAHRVAYKLFVGEIGGLHVLHHCDNPSCVNVEHLFLGTHKQNMEDKVRKRRHHKHYRTHCVKGHAYSEHVFYSHSSQRRCRVCSNISSLESYHRRKASNAKN